MENAEILGIILTLCGIVYIFLQGMGKLSDKGGEIETRLLSLKGGAGLILVALGITIFAVGDGAGGLTNILSEVGIKPAPTGSGSATPASLEPGATSPVIMKKSIPSVSSTSQSLSDQVNPTPTSTQVTPASTTVRLKAIDKESAGVSSNGGAFGSWWVGDNRYNGANQAFFSFNIANIPANATLIGATLDFGNYGRNGDPFSDLGCLGVYKQDYGAPDASDFFIGTPTNAITKWCSDAELSESLPIDKFISALQSKLGTKRFQIRIQFDKITDNDDMDDQIASYLPELIISYTTS